MAFDLLQSNSSAGEPEWDALYRLHAAELRRLIARRVPPGAPVDDLLQEAFYQAYRSRHRVDVSRPVAPWLTTIAARVCIAWWRRQRPEGVPWDAEERTDPAVFPGSDEHLASIVRGEQVSLALAGLSSRHRTLLLGHVDEGLSCEHLARVEGSSAKAVKSALNRARMHFRRHLRTAGGRGAALPAGVAVACRRWSARWQRAVPMAEGVGAWAGAAVALGLVAALSIAPVAMRAEQRAHALAADHAAAVGREAMADEASGTSAAVRGRQTDLESSGAAPSAGRTTLSGVAVGGPGLGTTADVSRTPEGVWTVFDFDVENPVLGDETNVGASVRCTSGMVATAMCGVGETLSDAGG